jgi:hypothetical protein
MSLHLAVIYSLWLSGSCGLIALLKVMQVRRDAS